MAGRMEKSGVDALLERLYERLHAVREQINDRLKEHIAPLEDDLEAIGNEIEHLKSVKEACAN